MAPKSEKPGLAARRGRHIAQALFLAMAAAFIVISTVEIGRQVFGYTNTYAEVSPSCGFSLRFFEDRIDRGESRALRQPTAGESEDSITGTVQMGLDTVAKQCNQPQDQAAVLAAYRLRDATILQLDNDHDNLARLRRALDMRIGRDQR